MFPRPYNTQHLYCNRLIIILIISAVWCQSTYAYKLVTLTRDIELLNPNLRCPGKNVENIWHHCKYGGFIENLDPKNCADRYICYVGVNEPCRREDKCADNAICTMCGICQKCDSPDNCSDFDLCPNYGFRTMNLIKRIMQNHSLENKLAYIK